GQQGRRGAARDEHGDRDVAHARGSGPVLARRDPGHETPSLGRAPGSGGRRRRDRDRAAGQRQTAGGRGEAEARRRAAAGAQSSTSDGITPAVVLVVLVEPALSGSEFGERFDEPDGLYPLHLLEAQLELVAETKWRSVQLGQRLAVHL